MKREEVELITFRVVANEQEALYIDVYKDGTVSRRGNGGLPTIKIAGSSVLDHADYFNHLVERIPDDLFIEPITYKEEQPNGMLAYEIGLYGVSKNGKTGEDAEWTKSTGIRLELDLQTQFKHPVFAFADYFVMEATEITNDWYFDIMVSSMYGLKSSLLPEKTMVSQPKDEKELREAFEYYVYQIEQSPKKWDLSQFVKNKTYSDGAGNSNIIGIINKEEGSFNITFESEATT